MELGPIIISEDEALRDLTLFHLTGRRPFWAPVPGEDQLPALLHTLRSVSHVRFDYPVVVSGERVRTLSALIDELLENTTAEGDASAMLTREIHRLEVLIRSSYAHGDSLLQSWDDGVQLLLLGVPPARRSEVARRVAPLRPDTEGMLLDCTPETMGRLLTVLGGAAEKTSPLREKVLRLRASLQSILAAGAPAGFHEEHSEVDSEALAGLLEGKHVVNPIPTRRKLRLQTTEKLLGLLESELAEGNQAITIGGRSALTDLEKVLTSFKSRVMKAVRALRVAELEAANRYRESRHDPLFEGFGWTDLLPEDLAAFPPPLVVLDTRECDEGIQPSVLRLLAADIPVKLLLLYDVVYDEGLRPSTWSRLALSAATTEPALVWSGSASAISSFSEGVSRAMRFNGPALLAAYLPPSITLPAYLNAAAAQDARIVPSFIYDPSAGDGWAARFTIEGNVQIERIWPVEEKGGGAFTAADFAACDLRLRRHFAVVDHPFECLAPFGSDGPVPYITMIDGDGQAHYAVLTRHVADFAKSAADHWAKIRELAGIENSHARRAVDVERARFEDELERAVEEAEARIKAEYERATSGIAAEIVSNIAAGLLHLPRNSNGNGHYEGRGPRDEGRGSRDEGRGSGGEGRRDEPEIGAASEVVADVEVEEDLVLDEAYIDTPLCTTCNECTNLNSLIFAYNGDRQAYVKDPAGGPYRDLVTAAELCPVHIIHPGKPRNPSEPGLEELVKRSQPYL